MSYRKMKAEALALARGLGMRAVFVRGYPTLTWDGTTAYVRDVESLLHELAHYQLAPWARRDRANFGLGSDPNSAAHLGAVVSSSRAAYEEAMASLLGIAWVRHLGGDWESVYVEHNWDRPASPVSEENFLKGQGSAGHYARHLTDLGLLTDDRKPVDVLVGDWRCRERGRKAADAYDHQLYRSWVQGRPYRGRNA